VNSNDIFTTHWYNGMLNYLSINITDWWKLHPIDIFDWSKRVPHSICVYQDIGRAPPPPRGSGKRSNLQSKSVCQEWRHTSYETYQTAFDQLEGRTCKPDRYNDLENREILTVRSYTYIMNQFIWNSNYLINVINIFHYRLAFPIDWRILPSYFNWQQYYFISSSNIFIDSVHLSCLITPGLQFSLMRPKPVYW
jgi:hypothetical protein